MNRLSLISPKYYEVYRRKQPITLLKHFNKLNSPKKSFVYSDTVSAVYSSMIEGNNMDLDTYMQYTSSGMNTRSKSYREIHDLIDGYNYAKKHRLNLKNALKAHGVITSTLLENKKYQGKLRDKGVYVFSNGEKVYTGATVDVLDKQMKLLFKDIAILISRELSINEVFYYASMIHLHFVKIHPFADGNGRSARLIEKWFLAEKLGVNAWHIQSERLYQKRIKSYYKNVDIGTDYTTNNFDLSIPFLLMLPMSLRLK